MFRLYQTLTLSEAENPNDLDYSKCDDSGEWCVFLDGHIIASVSKCAGCRAWFVSSDQDGYQRGVGAMKCAAEYIKYRLDTLYRNNRFDDLGNLPGKIELVGIHDAGSY